MSQCTSAPNDTTPLTSLELYLTGGGLFNDVEFMLFGGNASTVDFVVTDDSGTPFKFDDIAISPSGFFGFQGINGQSISNVSFTLNGGNIQDIRQLRLAAVIPEPTSWAMMIAGFGLVGGAMRQRRTINKIGAI